MMKNKNLLGLCLVTLTGAFLLFSRTDFQFYLSQGDHGRDLYAFEATLYGEVPYRDYWWVYGPLMPYYYSLFYKFFGIKITSALIAKAFLNLCSGIFVYLTLRTMLSFAFAYFGALWFWVFYPGFFFTYNHAGGITAYMFILYMLFCYVKDPKNRYLAGGLIALVILSFIKLNFGLSALIVFLFSIFLTDRFYQRPVTDQKKMFYIFSLFILPPMIFLTYFSFVYDFPFYMIRQCFPYLKADQQHYISLLSGISSWFEALLANIVSSVPNLCFGVIVVASIDRVISLLLSKSVDKNFKRQVLLVLIIPSLFYLVNLQEFIRSGVTYRSHWSTPFSIILLFTVIFFGTRSLHRIIRFVFLGVIALIIQLTLIAQTQTIWVNKVPTQYLSHPRAQVYIANTSQWIETIDKTTRYLESQLKPGETFFAFPYDPIYYFLAGRKSPTRQLIFFNHINVPQEQEKTVIRDLEDKEVNYVVLSNRSKSADNSLGIFGETYCPLIKRYLDDHFVKIERFGDWKDEPGWAWNHATVILKRKP